jgi:type VI secretion system secreted protein VgrG
MTGVEALSWPFAYEVDIVSERADVQASEVLGRPLSVHLQAGENEDQVRHWNGTITALEYVAQGDDGMSRYRLTVRPWLWYLTRRADCRIFQNLQVPDILRQVFEGAGFGDFEMALGATYPVRDYVVQYRETDFDFVSRLMQREGIYYFFRHDDGKHTLVLADGPQAHQPAAGYERIAFAPPDGHRDQGVEYVRLWKARSGTEAAQYTHADYDFTRPRARLYATSKSPADDGEAGLEVYDYPGGFLTSSDGDAYARLRLEQLRRDVRDWVGEGNARGLTAGALFSLTDHPVDDQNAEYLIVSTRYRLQGHELRTQDTPQATGEEPSIFDCELRAIAGSETFRPPRVTPKPRALGPQTALVVGPAGREIWTDQYGRIKVQFFWDRLGQTDEQSSCWVRVSQAWAGSGWGAQFIPRIGQEVIVDFLEGDPDQPIVTGCVYNAANMPAFSLPYNQTQSGFKTRSTPGGTLVNGNEIRFEDMKGSEDFFVQAEKTQTTLVKDSQSVTIGTDRTMTVGGAEAITVAFARTTQIGAVDALNVLGASTTSVAGIRTLQVGADSQTNIGGSRRDTVSGDADEAIAGGLTETVGASRATNIGRDLSLTVAGRVDAQVAGDHSETFGGNFTERHAGHRVVIVGSPDGKRSATLYTEGSAQLQVSDNIDATALVGVTVTCGKSEIRILPDSITVTSPKISLVSKDIELTGDKVVVTASGALTLGGDSVKMTSSGASVALDSNATVQGGQVKLSGGSGASGQSDKQNVKVTTIELKDQDGKPLAHQRIILRTGGEGGPEKTVVLDENGKYTVTGDDSFEVFIPEVTDPRKN